MKKTEMLYNEAQIERMEDIEEKAKRIIDGVLNDIAIGDAGIRGLQKQISKHQNRLNKLLEKTPQEIVDESEEG